MSTTRRRASLTREVSRRAREVSKVPARAPCLRQSRTRAERAAPLRRWRTAHAPQPRRCRGALRAAGGTGVQPPPNKKPRAVKLGAYCLFIFVVVSVALMPVWAKT